MEKQSARHEVAEARAAYTLPAGDASAVLSKAVVRAAARLDLTQSALARVLGLSNTTASRLAAGNWLLPAESKSWELATLLLRVYRSLDAITGGKVEAMRAWLHSPNAALGGSAPAQRLVSAEGLVDVLHYLDASRSRI